MKKILSTYKFPLIILINTIPFALDVLLYSKGMMDNLYLFFAVFVSLTILNYYSSNKVAHYIILQVYLLVCLISSGCMSTHLYYNNISDDPMTPAIGMLLICSGAIVVIVTTIITAIVKKRNQKRE